MHLRGLVATLAAATLALGLFVSAAPAGAAAAPVAPPGLTVTRVPDNPTAFTITWKPVDGVSHYNVSVFDGATDSVTRVAAGTTSLTVKGSGDACRQYRVSVGSRDSAGVGETSGYVWLKSLAPGGVTGMSGGRGTDTTTANATWTAPAWAGYGKPGGYAVEVVRLSDGATVQRRTSADEIEKISNLDPSRQYAIKVRAVNAYGSCVTGRVLVGNQLPGATTGLTVTRDPAVPAAVSVRWSAPGWSGYTPVAKYQLGYGNLKATTWITPSGTSATLKLDPALSYVFQVRAVNEAGTGPYGRTVNLGRFGANGTAAQHPSVTLDEAAGDVSIAIKGPIGSSTDYPQLAMRIKPTIGTGYSDYQLGQNGAQTVLFSSVPCGNYTVSVVGLGTGGEKEFARKVVNRCDTGLLSESEWKVVFGRAALPAPGSIDMPNGSETRVMSTRTRATGDMVLTADADLRSGWGYGVWARASFSSTGAISGYSFQFDPGYKNVDAAFGPAFILRHWSNGVECSTALARVKIPTSISLYGKHELVVVAKGDGLYATIDKLVVFDVPSLNRVVNASPCKMPAPSGKGIGFRTWGSGTSAVFTNVTLT